MKKYPDRPVREIRPFSAYERLEAQTARYRQALEEIARRTHQSKRDGRAAVAAHNIARRALDEKRGDR